MGFTLAVNTVGDDDFIGWSIGYEQGENFQNSGDWLLFDWKQNTQDVNGNLANAGLRVWRVTGPVVSQNSIVVSVHHSAKSGELSSDGRGERMSGCLSSRSRASFSS